MAEPLFRITMTPDLTKVDRRSAEFERKLAEAARHAVIATAVAIKDKLYQALARSDQGGLFNVGASGASAESFSVRTSQHPLTGDQEAWVESDGTAPGAKYILTGTVGMGRRADWGAPAAGGMPPISAIREWMLLKKGEWRAPEDMGAAGYLTASRRVRYTKREGRPWRRSESLFERVSWILQRSIYAKGISVYSERYRPNRQKWFDYPEWVAAQSYIYTEILDRSAGLLAEACLQFVQSGDLGALSSLLERVRHYAATGAYGGY